MTNKLDASVHPTPVAQYATSECIRTILRPLVPVAAWIAFASLSLCLAGCGPLGLDGPSGESKVSAASEKSITPVDNTPAVVIDGETITLTDVHEHMQTQFLEELLRQPDDKIYELRENAIRDLVQRHVINSAAEERGTTPEALFAEITAAPAAPTDEDVANWFTENQARLRGANLADISDNIKELLMSEAKGKAWSNFVTPRLEALEWEMAIEPPRKNLAATRLVRGAADAPVTIMTFSDYQCPYCIRAEPVLAEVLERYPDSVRVIQRHFPLDNIHPFARPAAEAAMCAEEQGKFWEFHDAIFALNGRLEDGSLLKIGGELGLDLSALGTCMSDRRFQKFVQDDMDAGEAAGVTGTPAFFVNGIPMRGSRDANEFARVVDAELARIGKN